MSLSTGAGGLAAVEWTFGTSVGSNGVQATAAGFNVTFAGTGVAGPATTLAKQAGDNQTAVAGSALPIQPAVVVEDAAGNPVAGVTVNFAIASGGGTIANAQALTDGQGIASGGTWTLGPAAGANTLTATAPGLSGSPATFAATGSVLPPGSSAAIIKVRGDGQTAVAGQPAAESLVVQVRDANGTAVPGATVTWSVLTGGGSVSLTSVITDAGGLVGVEWTLGSTAGANTVQAGVAGFNATFTGTGVAGAATTLAQQAGDNQTATVSSPLPINPTVSVTDAGGNPVSGVLVSFAVTSGGGSVAAAQNLTDAQGIASGGSWTLGPAVGPNTLTATAAGLSGSPATFSATGTVLPPGPPAGIIKVSGDAQTAVAGGIAAESLVVQVRDANGAGVPGITVTWAVLTGGGSVSSVSLSTGAGGLAAVEWTLGTVAGSNTARASAAGFSRTFTGTGVAGAATTLATQSGDNQTATVSSPVPINPAVIVTDAGGNPVSGVSVSFAVTGGGGSIAVAQNLTDVQGIASGGTWTLGPAAGANALTATSAGLSGSPATFTATGIPVPPGPPGSITRISGDAQSVVAGEVAPESLVVQVRDANGTVVPGATITWSVLTGGGSVSSASVITDAGGLAAVEWTLGNVAGPNIVQATVAGFNTIFTATGVPGAAALLVKQAGDNQSAPVSSSAPVDPVVKVTDAAGNPVAGVSVSFAIAGGGGGISNAQALTDAQGLASGGTWTLGPAAGPNSLTAAAAGLSGSPATFSATGTVLPPGPPASITRISGDAQSVVAGEVAPESLVVQVRDANGVGLNGITVTWTILTGGGSVSPVSLSTGAGGLAAVEWTIGTITGTNSVRATAAGFNATFTADGIAGAPATLTRVSGNNQTAPAGSPVALDPTVAVHDANGNSVPGVSVGFAVTAGGGSIQNSSGLTDSQGRTNGGTWTLGAVAGANELTATVSGLAGSPLPFTATGTPTTGPPASLAIISGDNQTATVAMVLPESLVVKVADAGGAGIPGVAVSWTILGGGGTVSSSTVNTDLAGLAAVELTLGTVAGNNSVEASAAGFTQAFTATGVAGPPARLAIVTQPGSGQSGVVLGVQPLLQLLDGNGNPAPQAGLPVAAAIASGGGALGGTISMITDGAGRAQFTDLSISGLVGSRTLAFNSAGLTGVTSTSLSIAAGPAANLSKQVGDNQSALAGTPVAVNPRVVVTDASGNPVSGVTVDFTVTSGGGSVAAGSSVTTPLGRATGGQWILGPAAGSNTLTATAAGLAGSPAVFTATGTSTTGAPASIAKVDGDNQTAIVGTVTTDSLVVQVLDANGNGVPGIAVSWVVLSGGGALSSAAGTTDATGLASDAWTLGVVAGPNTARATAAGFNATFSASGVAGPAVSLSKQSGDNQTAEVNTVVPVDPTVLVVDAQGNPVGGVMVSFTVIAGNGTIALPSAATNALGIATGGNWTLGPVAGSHSLRASAPGLTGSPALFTATGTSAAHTPVPLIDLGAGTYFGFPGGLYPTGNTPPAAHAAAGAARARNVRPRSFNGNPNANGKFVLLSIGLSNTTMEWCTAVVTQPCNSWSLMGQAAADATVNHQEMVISNGARPGQEADTWESPTDLNYDLVRDNVLLPQGLSEQQVEIVWLKVVNGNPQTSLPSNQADAIDLVTQYGNILRALKVRYPNLQMVFFSSRIYAGYATITLNPEPYAYETGFAVKWVIEAQIDQMANGGTIVDPRAGNLNLNTVAPWIGWGPYLWADGLNPRSDGLTWVISDYELDHTHPARAGQTKVAGMLLNFFKTDSRASCWFRAGLTCP